MKKLTQAEFIAKAVAVHGDKYDYSQTVYLPQPHKVAISCPEHGVFEQVANLHIQGKGCKRCADNVLSQNKTLDVSDFMRAARARHGEKYDYSEVVYTHGKGKVKIRCSAHGLFEQQATNHTQGQGCPMCARALRAQVQSSGVALDFVSRAIAVHGERYDYSRVIYRNSKSLVQIICPIHGLFEQRPHNHLAGRRCKYCVGPLSQNTKTFVERARATHGEQYNYSQAIYKGAKLKIKIICPVHGLFEQEASSHTAGCGCPDCGLLLRAEARIIWNTASFVVRCQELHPALDFSQAIYSGSKAKVQFSCPRHGVQHASASRLLAGEGCCHLCGNDKMRLIRKGREVWLAEFVAIHGERYDYSQVADTFLAEQKIIITCPQHGPFQQQASSHQQGQGCKKCVYERAAIRRRKGSEAWLAEFVAAHGNYYDYSQVADTFGAAGMYTIICPQHGEFRQGAHNHALGQGCPECSLANRGFSRSEWTARAVGKTPQLYLIKCYNELEVFYKIGLTFRSIAARFASGFPYSYEVIRVLRGIEAGAIYDLEKQIKRRFGPLRYRPKKPFAGATECFSSAGEILAIFPL